MWSWLHQQYFSTRNFYRCRAIDSFLYFPLFPKRGSQSLDFQRTSSQPRACSLCKNICSCQAASYSACPPSRLHRPLISPRKTKDWTSLWPCGIVHAPLSSLSFLFFSVLRCGLLPVLSPQPRGEWSIIKIVMGSGREIVRKPTSPRDMLNSCCEKHAETGKRVRERRSWLCPVPRPVIHANKPQHQQQHWHQWSWLWFFLD